MMVTVPLLLKINTFPEFN